MNDAEIIQAFREKAKLYTRLANDLERAAGSGPTKKVTPDLPSLSKLTLEELRSSLKTKGGRLIHVAARLNVTSDAIQDLIDQPGSGIIVAPRGWLKLIP